MRRLVATVLYFLAASCILLGGLVSIPIYFGESMVDDTIENSHEIQRAFVVAAAFADSVILKTGRPPTARAFEHWSRTRMMPKYFEQLTLVNGDYSEEVIRLLGNPPVNSYALRLWRGEWEEFFAGWSHESTLTFDESDYYVLGSARKDAFATLATVGLVAYLMAISARRLARASINEPGPSA